MIEESEDRAAEAATPAVLRVLTENHERFLRFLERRVGSRPVAEEILQDAFVRGIEKGGAIHKEESTVAWCYRLLRNAIVDHHRRRGAEERALQRHAHEPAAEPDGELESTVCACLHDLIGTLKAEYAAILRRVDLEGVAVDAAAREAGITANNAAVRLHRARRALRGQLERSCGTCTRHGCLHCSCERPASEGSSAL